MECDHSYDNDYNYDNVYYEVMMEKETVYDDVFECDHSYDNDDDDDYVGDDGRGDGV